jgi:hypothetical protein
MADIRSNPMPTLNERSGSVQEKQFANPQRTTPYQPAHGPSMEADGLLRGLSQFNSALGSYTDHAIQQTNERDQGIAHRLAAAQAAVADVSTPEATQKRVAADLPAGVPPAFGGYFRETLGALLVDRNSVRAKTQWAADYMAEKDKPGFDPEAFIGTQRAKALTGLTDPGLAGRMAVHLNELEGAARSMNEKDRLKKLDEARETGLYTSLQENLRADMTPAQHGEQFFKYQPLWEQLGFSKKELAARLFSRTQQLSEQMGGNPQVFDVFNAADPKTGQTLLSLNPELAHHVDAAREQAKAKNLKMLQEAAQSANLPTRVQLDEMAEKDPTKVTMELVQRHMGKLGIFQTTDEAAAFLAKARRNAEKMAGQEDLLKAYDTGMLGRYDVSEQKQVLELKLGPAVTEAWKRAVGGDGQAMTALAAHIIGEQSRARATVPVEAITRLVQSSLSSVQNPNGPTPEFGAMAALYRGLSADPKFRELYFKEDADQLMRAYLRGTDAGSDPTAAYKAAYQSIDPAAKEAAHQFTKTPEFAKKLKSVTDNVTGMSWWNKYLPFTAQPANALVVQTAASDEARQYLSSHPYADPSEIGEHLASWTAQNFVFDKNSKTAIRVPAGSADETMQEALTEYSKKVADVYRLSDRKDGDWKVQFRPVGDGNLAHVVLSNGSAEQALGTLPLASVRQAFVAEKSATPQDATVYAELQKQLRTGKLDLAYVESNVSSLAKARSLKLLPEDTLKAIDKARLDQAKAMVDSVPKLALPAPTLEHLSTVPNRAVKVDNKLTAEVATSLLSTGGELGLAASLTTMGEAVVLKASPDPAKDAGNNIGMGYNLKANAKNAAEDLRKAGVSADRIDAVIRGEAQLTPVQAQKLLLVTLPRYQKQAIDVAEETAPGLWKRMTPSQKAVMTDVAWQTGDISQFRKAWRALAAGDAQAFANETKVFFTNAKGERVEDKRRGELRAAMLNGDAAWISTMQKYGSFPTNALEAVALNQPK